MKATYIEAYGNRSKIKCGERPKPSPGAGEVLVKVKAAAINPIDWKIRQGKMRFFIPLKFPYIMGYDVSGVVEEVGSGVQGFKPGDEVFGILPVRQGGAYAQFAVCPENQLAPKPDNLTFEEACGLPIAGITALQALDKFPAKRVLVLGGAGGVGHMAVQIAKARGAHVTATCSGENGDWVRDLGADEVVDYKENNPFEGEGRYDLVLDSVVASTPKESFTVLNPGGVYTAPLPSLGIMMCLPLNLFRSRKAYYSGMSVSAQALAAMGDLAKTHGVKPRVEGVLALEQVMDGHDISEVGRARGKLVIVPV